MVGFLMVSGEMEVNLLKLASYEAKFGDDPLVRSLTVVIMMAPRIFPSQPLIDQSHYCLL